MIDKGKGIEFSNPEDSSQKKNAKKLKNIIENKTRVVDTSNPKEHDKL
jgi:hypothetical protein